MVLGVKKGGCFKTVALKWGDIQDIFLFGCPKTIDITGFFKKFCIATRTTPKNAIQEYLDYIKNNDSDTVYISELANEARRATEEVRNDEAKEVAYMTMQMKMMDERRAGRAEGRAEGRVEGARATTLEHIRNLMHKLGYSSTDAMNMLGISTEEQPMYTALLELQ